MKTKLSKLGQAAAAYAALYGWAVLPVHTMAAGHCTCGDPDCKSPGKHPRTEHGASDATADQPAIRKWWTRWPAAGVGLHCGKNGLVVIDIDPRNGGDDTWRALETEHGVNTDTLINLTGGGGRHLLYNSNGVGPEKLAGELGPGVDVKKGNGYVILPPSVHPNGRTYSWEVSAHPQDRRPADLPAPLLALLKNGGEKQQKRAKTLPDMLPEGRRNTTLTSLAGTMRARGMGEPAILAALREENAQRCDPPLADKELAAIAKSIAKKAPATAKEKSAGRKLKSANYHALYKKWGYEARLNLCNDDLEVNGELLTDNILADIRQRVRDYAIEHRQTVGMGAVEDSLVTLGLKRSYHPVTEYLEALTWDGQDNIGALAVHFDGGARFGRLLTHWLVGAVARVYGDWQNPMLCLDGPQGIGKSYFAKWLCGALEKMFVESPICPDYKDHRLRLIQTFIWEVQELGATTRKADQDALKAFLTLGSIKERKAYGRRPIQKTAICSFIGTINNDAGFLTDRTGNRRYIIIKLKSIDWAYAGLDVGQVWAHAMHLWKKDDAWKLSKAEQEQSERVNRAYLVSEPIELFLTDAYTFTGDPADFVQTSAILAWLNTTHNISSRRSTGMTVARILTAWGCEKRRQTVGGKQVRGYTGLKAQN